MTYVELDPDFPEDLIETVRCCERVVNLAKDHINGGGTSMYWTAMAQNLREISQYVQDNKKPNVVVEETLEDSP